MGNNNIEKLNVSGKDFDITPWGALGLSKQYLLALLSRDEYCPVADKQPTETDVLYTDPASGNPAGFHAGQCVVYPDKDVPDGWGLSIAKKVETDAQGMPIKVIWQHLNEATSKEIEEFWNEEDGGEVAKKLLGLSAVQKIRELVKAEIKGMFTPSQLTDGKTYGFRNGVPELIADDGEVVLVDDADTAYSLAKESLKADKLLLPSDQDPEMIEEIKQLLGEELFNELATKSIQTMELTPQLTEEQELEKAKAEYYQRKELARQDVEMKKQLEASEILTAEDVSELDVEQDKAE